MAGRVAAIFMAAASCLLHTAENDTSQYASPLLCQICGQACRANQMQGGEILARKIVDKMNRINSITDQVSGIQSIIMLPANS
jgi:hypothetical protein